MATDMYRTAISLPKDMEDKIFELRKRDEFVRCSYSEIIRKLLASALELDEYKTEPKPSTT